MIEDTYLFVYGSLLKGESHHHLLAKSIFLGRDALAGMQLFDLGEYPMIYPGSGTVYGERYQIPLSLLLVLDDFEDHPEIYQRQWLLLASGEKAWAYVGQPFYTSGYPWVAGGDWRRRY
jgi:gamma-glutamylcyclotransferase (GGCT)/AIG2-like uncharacterized protein YtfP